jgi:CHAT domain/FHA domain
MSDTQHLPLSVQPVVKYPREAQIGKTYLMTIDLQPLWDEWRYEEEEYPIYCMLETSPLFSNKPVDEPAIVLHRFGGSYGAAKFLLTAAQEEMDGGIRVTLANQWGVPIRVLNLDDIKIRQQINHPLKVIAERQQQTAITQTKKSTGQLQQSSLEEENREVVFAGAKIQEPETSKSVENFDNPFYAENSVRPSNNSLTLSLSIARLVNTGTDNFAIWVVNAPYPSGYVLHDCVWPPNLTQIWQEWQQMFADYSRINVPSDSTPPPSMSLPLDVSPSSGQATTYASRLMQYLGMSLWGWVFDGPILSSFERSGGIAIGQHKRLRVQLDIRDPDLAILPWEIMQREPGQAAISLSQNILFSRTTSEVEPITSLTLERALNILLVWGENEKQQLEKEAAILEQTLVNNSLVTNNDIVAPCQVTTLLQPTLEELTQQLETNAYNVMLYFGHGLPGPDGGTLFLQTDLPLHGKELANILIRTKLKLAIFNGSWSIKAAVINQQTIPHSSLAEVLIRQGVPAVVTMRDEITDRESLSFLQALIYALRSRKHIDEAMTDARQHLLTIYRFNQPAWTLPVLYLHPDDNGELLENFAEGVTELPEMHIPILASLPANASLRSLASDGKTWLLRTGITRIGRTADNDIVIPEPSVSKRHAEILCRITWTDGNPMPTYYLQDLSTYGTTWVLRERVWQQIHRQEILLQSGVQLKFGSTKSQPWEFIIQS